VEGIVTAANVDGYSVSIRRVGVIKGPYFEVQRRVRKQPCKMECGKGSPFEVLGRSESDLKSSDRAGGRM
jgi:hypothetical protein